MAEKHLTDGTTALAAQPRVIKIEAAEKPRNAQLRVAAYTRVSSDSDDQLNSFAAQNRYYAELISGKAEWRMVDIYADEGITGTSAAKREDFQRMMADCRRGLIGQILVKSISRFARNTKDCLEAVRELKELGVNVRFEREGIDTANVSSELITAIYAAFAQKESESISGNMRWSYQRRMEAGTFLPSSMAYGYKLVDRKIEIDADAALVVCRIFQWYLNGVNRIAIAKMLNEEGISSGQRKKWHSASVRYILTNEKYTGDSLWQKTYTSDTLPATRHKNTGEHEQYYPLLFSQFGEVYLPTSYGSLFAFFMMGAALLAVGMFLSSLTDNQGFAAGIGIAAILLNYYSVSLAEYTSSTAMGSLIALYVIALLLGVVIHNLTRNENLAYGVTLVLIAALSVAYFVNSSAFEGLLPDIMTKLSLFRQFNSFVNGAFDLTAIVYYVSVMGFFLFLSVQSMEKRRYN